MQHDTDRSGSVLNNLIISTYGSEKASIRLYNTACLINFFMIHYILKPVTDCFQSFCSYFSEK